MNKTYIRTFNASNAKIHDVELIGNSDDVRVALFCARRAVAVDGFAVILTQSDAVSEAVHDAFLDGYIGNLINAEGGAAFSDPCKSIDGWIVVRVFSEGAAERASDSPLDVMDEEVWYLTQWVDYRECLAAHYDEDVNSL